FENLESNMATCGRFLRLLSSIRRRLHAAKVCRAQSGCRHQKLPQRTPSKFLLRRWRRGRPGRRRGCCGSQTQPRKPAQESRPNRPSILPAQAARFVERTTGDGLSLLGPKLPESGIPLGGCQLRSHVFAPPPLDLPVAFALRRRRLYYLRTRRNVESRSPLSLPGVEPF